MTWIVARITRGMALLAIAAWPLAAQHTFGDAGATYDPAVPTPRAILGYELGSRFTTHRAMMRYIERIAAASKRVKVDTVARSFEGREMLLITVTSEANMARLAEIQRDAKRVADPRGAAAGEVEAAAQAAFRRSSGWRTRCTAARPPAWRPAWRCSTSWRPAPTPRRGWRSTAPSC